jgi:hypothetical protein
LKKKNQLQRLNPKAWVGYLVNYNSTNIYRIWVLRLAKVIYTRDVTFNEDEVFNSNIESKSIKENIQNTTLEEFTKMLEKIEEPNEDEIELTT